MQSLADILQQRIEAFKANPELAMKTKGTQYQKDWNFAVKCFQDRLNKDRKKEKKPEVTFMQVKMKLMALKEIDDLRWFYRECLKYAGTYPKGSKVRNTFSKCFWGATRLKK